MTDERVGQWDWRIGLITVPLLVGLGSLSGWLSGSGYGNPWFDALVKPPFMPPGWAFGAAWTILYALMGIALAMILAEPASKRRRTALMLFLAQLVVNYAWSPIFFAGHDIQLALITILIMLALAAATLRIFLQLRPLAGALLIPYLAWLCFAAALTASINRLNPGAGTPLFG